MRHLNRTMLGAACAAVLLGAPTLYAQTSSPNASLVQRQAAAEIIVSQLIGARVVNTNGEAVGDINYLISDATGRITTVVVGVGGVLGMGEKNVGMKFDALNLTKGENGAFVASVNVARADLEAAPKFEWMTVPLGVRVEESLKGAAETVTTKAKELTKRAQDAMNPEPEKK